VAGEVYKSREPGAERRCRLRESPQNADVDSPESYRPSQKPDVDFLSTTERL